MSVSQAAYTIEKVVGHEDNAITTQDISEFEHTNDANLMNALIWTGKNQVEIGKLCLSHRRSLTRRTILTFYS